MLLPQEAKPFSNHVRAWVKALDNLGLCGLKHSSANRDWTAKQRFELVVKVLAGNSVVGVAKNAHIKNGQARQGEKRKIIETAQKENKCGLTILLADIWPAQIDLLF